MIRLPLYDSLIYDLMAKSNAKYKKENELLKVLVMGIFLWIALVMLLEALWNKKVLSIKRCDTENYFQGIFQKEVCSEISLIDWWE